MVKRRLVVLFVLIIILGISKISNANNIETMADFTKADRILILAPHPDDETIATAGVIKKALKIGAGVKVVCFTNGEQNELSFILSKKTIPFRKKQFISLGQSRIKETQGAMANIGLKKEDVVFLGYPDYWTMEIFMDYWQGTKPFKSIFTRISNVSYDEAMSYGAPYKGESVLKDLEKIIVDFKPTKIFVSHPADKNKDHRSLYLFLHVALWNLEGKVPDYQVFPYLIHYAGWPKPRGLYPDYELMPPDKISGITWQKAMLDPDEIKAKSNAIDFYKTQMTYSAKFLKSFVRKSELFGDFPVIKIKKDLIGGTWTYLRDASLEQDATKKDISNLAYRFDNDNFYIKLLIRKRIEHDYGVLLYLVGYKKGKSFSEMPKISVLLDVFGLHIKDKKKKIFNKDCFTYNNDKETIIVLPLKILGNPDHLLTYAKTKGTGLPLDEVVWRVIELE